MVALAVALQAINPCKGLMAFGAREMVVHRQVNYTVALKTVFPLEGFATFTHKDLNTQMDVFVAPQGCRIVEDDATSSTNIVNCSMEASLVHSQIGWPAKFSSTNITSKGIAVCVDFHVPPQLGGRSQFLSTKGTFVSDDRTVFHVVLHHKFRLEVLTAALALERQLTVFPLLVSFKDYSGLKSTSADITLVAVYLWLLRRHLQVKIDISLLVTHISCLKWC